MNWWWFLCVVTVVCAKGKKGRHQKPGRALFNRLASSPVEAIDPQSGLLVPPPMDAAPFAEVAANATCGEIGVEEFCRQTPGKRGIVCGVCEGLDGGSSRQHLTSYTVDGDPSTWWQSPTIASGEEYKHVDMVITLPNTLELLHVIIKSGPSPRPLAWSLEVSPSEDLEDFQLVKAFGDREHCRKIWDLRPERRKRKARDAKEKKRSSGAEKPTCSTQFSSPRPLENGAMHIALGEGVHARRVRLSFRATHPAPPEQQFYTIRTLTLAARCLCNGHAETCEVNKISAKCLCTHNTCGAHCERCCSNGLPSSDSCEDSPPENTFCSCGDRGECLYDDTGAVLCVNCTDNRAGPLCDKCLPGFYSPETDGPCLPCPCNLEGSDGTCKYNRKRHQPVCNCYPGVEGLDCDRCEDEEAMFPACDVRLTTHVCKCDPRGIVDQERVCDDVCECKVNVVGDRCDKCALGFFGLTGSDPDGCKPCFCSGISEHCYEDLEPGTYMALPSGEGVWLVTDLEGNETISPSIDNEGRPYVISYEVEGWPSFYWCKSEDASLRLYGSEVRGRMWWAVARGDAGGNPTSAPDFLLVGADGTKLASAFNLYKNAGDQVLSVPVIEGHWWFYHNGTMGPMATRMDLMKILSDLKALMIRAYFHTDQDEVRLDVAEVLPRESGVGERCSCPSGYAGRHCEKCEWTHFSVSPIGTTPVQCVPCDCNHHASCGDGGACDECQHNTTGDHCERCLPGYYGNPMQGGCKPCACPLYSALNNFSPNCVLAHPDGDDFVCTQCPEGYAGDRCEICDFGFWGSPQVEGSSCVRCECDGSPCDVTSGNCLECPPNTEGAECEQCQEGFWYGGVYNGSSTRLACVPCDCGAGALATSCDPRNGQCECRAGWAGRSCDRCQHGYGGISTGCQQCECGVASTSALCDRTTGACDCRKGTTGPRCDQCVSEHYGLSEEGCKGCNCSALGSESNVCDIRSGQCRCKPHAIGRACDTCEEGYWGLSVTGCKPCTCGAGGAACDPVTGACACPQGVTGQHCNECLPGFYGFGPNGCLPCGPCSNGRVCDSVTGRCVCPPHTRGANCKQCAPGYWGAPPQCRRCDCAAGAASGVCDIHNGQCHCRLGWSGRTCDMCAEGHFGPRCRQCDCEVAGSLDCDPRTGLCPCDSEGRCRCKENVYGDSCTKCREGTFGLSVDSPTGCTACFCFGRSAHCSQAGLTRAAVHAVAPRHVTLQQGNFKGVDQDSWLAIPVDKQDAIISLPFPPVPVYMELEKRFLGDKVTSYGGALRFNVEEEGGDELPPDVRDRFPLVRIYGVQNMVLDYYERTPAMNGSHFVRLHEYFWRSGESFVSRAALMVTLQKVQRILVRVTTRAPSVQQKVHSLLLNVSLDTTMPGISRTAPALGVELCSCPQGYSSSSCQAPSLGFWMPPTQISTDNVGGTIVIKVESGVKPCECNGRAASCDPDTGHCLNCTEGSAGPRCELCAVGWLGSPSSRFGCQRCPCPRGKSFHANACVFRGEKVICLCETGYAGTECELCDEGFFRGVDGQCRPCDCDPGGSVSHKCDDKGRCICGDHAKGDKCNVCLIRRTFMTERGCEDCDKCTITLLDNMDELTADLRRRADPKELSSIDAPYIALSHYANNVTKLSVNFFSLRNYVANSQNIERTLRNLEEGTRRLEDTAKVERDVAKMQRTAANSLSLESMTSLEDVLNLRRKIGEQTAMLDEFAKGERHLSAHRALKEARRLLKHIKDVRVIDYIAGANNVFDSANLQSTAIQEYNYRINDTYERLRQLQNKLDEWENKAEDFNKLADVVWDAGDTVAALEKNIKPRVGEIRDTGLRCSMVLEDVKVADKNNITDATKQALSVIETLSAVVPDLVKQLGNLTTAAEEKEGILYSLTPVYKKKYLEAVRKHVDLLSKRAEEYKNLFSSTRNSSSPGMLAARGWGDVTKSVRDANTLADEALLTANKVKMMARGTQPMIEAANVANKASNEQALRGAEVMKNSDALVQNLHELVRAGSRVEVQLRSLGWQERSLMVPQWEGVGSILSDAMAKGDRVFATSRVLYEEASALRNKVRYQLRMQLGELQKHGDTALGAAQEHVSQIRGNTIRAKEVVDALAAAAVARAEEHEDANRHLRPNIEELKEKIARAKHAADTISVSLTSAPGGTCARSYPIPVSSPSTTKVALSLSFDILIKDGPILHLVGEQGSMKLIVQQKRFKLLWDIGGGEGLIIHPEKLEASFDEADHHSYRIEIERVWNTVHLTVERAGRNGASVQNSTSDEHTNFLVHSMWLGSDPKMSSGGLVGCVHSVHYDDKRIGLWNFVKNSGACQGCTQRSYNPPRSSEPSLIWFNGDGYSELKRTGFRPYDPRQFSVSFSFRTRDHDALLFTAKDPNYNRSVSVMIRSCRVVFLVEYTSSTLEIIANGRHCHGRTVHVQAIRLFANNKLERGSLRVNGEETLGSPSPPVVSPSSLPSLGSSPLRVGERLRGCLGSLTVDREGYDPMDTTTRYGLEPTCQMHTIRSAKFMGNGHVEISSPAFRRKASLGVTFSANHPNGTILYRTPASLLIDNELQEEDGEQDDRHYLAIVIVDGELEIRISAGRSELVLRTNGTRYDDGRLHTLRLLRSHKEIELWLDSAKMASGGLAGNALPARSRGLFLGGLPDTVHKDLFVGFKGTIADFIVDGVLIGLESSSNWNGVLLGRSDGAAMKESKSEPRELQAQPDKSLMCSKAPSYTVEPGAVKFGDVTNSHILIKMQNKPNKDLALTLQFRMFAEHGLLALVPGNKSKPKHYLALLVRDGKLRLVVRGRKKREISLAAQVNDGTWKTVQLRVTPRRISLSSSGTSSAAVSPRKLGLSARLYLGGLPDRNILPHLPDSLWQFPLLGCMRGLLVRGSVVDLGRSPSLGVGQCFPDVQEGAHFAGDAYAVWSSSWTGLASGADIASEFRLQFKTTEPNGIIATSKNFLLEIRDGIVILGRYSPRGDVISKSESVSHVCDGVWHLVRGRLSPTITLLIDEVVQSHQTQHSLTDDTTDTPIVVSTLYIGGVPESLTDGIAIGRENFKGCIKDLAIGGQNKEFNKLEATHNVLLDSCPVTK